LGISIQPAVPGFLLDKFHRSWTNARAAGELLARAADLAWDAGNFEGAIRFFLQAEAFDKAAAGIKKIAMGLSAQGRFADLAGWIDILPDAMVAMTMPGCPFTGRWGDASAADAGISMLFQGHWIGLRRKATSGASSWHWPISLKPPFSSAIRPRH
jgi:hypothetical protein